MSKRQADQSDLRQANKSNAPPNERQQEDELMGEMGTFEDEFEDEVEEEEIIEGNEDANGEEESNDMEVDEKTAPRTYMPGDPLEEGEVLEHDPSVYVMLHNLNVRLPFLSFDIMHDSLGENRNNFPATAYVAAGTSVPSRHDNEVLVMKLSNLQKTQSNEDDDDDNDDPDILDEDPILEYQSIPHDGCVNRIRLMPQIGQRRLASTWSETGRVHVWDLAPQMKSLDTPGSVLGKEHRKPLATVQSHGSNEGYAMDWSVVDTGRLLTGDVAGRIYMSTLNESSGCTTDTIAYREHKSSVEDIQWSSTERNVFASCSADQTVKIWDTRNKKRSALTVHASQSDVNVITWNQKASYLLASGHDDGIFSVWDLRTVKSDGSVASPVATFKWHSAPITSIEWHPSEESVLAVAGADDQISLWDLSVELDTEEKAVNAELEVEVPPQLLFVHQGQTEIKELHWHKQIPGCVMSTASSGFNIFKTISVS